MQPLTFILSPSRRGEETTFGLHQNLSTHRKRRRVIFGNWNRAEIHATGLERKVGRRARLKAQNQKLKAQKRSARQNAQGALGKESPFLLSLVFLAFLEL